MKKSDITILIKNGWNSFLRVTKKNAIKIYVLLLLLLFLLLFIAPQYNEPIAFLTLFSGLILLVMYCDIKTYIRLEASSKSSVICDLKNKEK